MRKVVLALMFVCGIAQAQEPSTTFDFPKTVKCFKTTFLFKELRESFNEEVVGYSKNVITGKKIALTVSKKDSWTLVEFDEKIACILAIGDNYTPIPPKPTL